MRAYLPGLALLCLAASVLADGPPGPLLMIGPGFQGGQVVRSGDRIRIVAQGLGALPADAAIAVDDGCTGVWSALPTVSEGMNLTAYAVVAAPPGGSFCARSQSVSAGPGYGSSVRASVKGTLTARP